MMTKPDVVSDALYSQQSGKGKEGQCRQKGNKWCSHCKATSHDTEYYWKLKNQDGKKRKREFNQVICYYCGDEGHTQRDCPIKQKGQAARSRNRESSGRPRGDGPSGSGSGENGTSRNGNMLDRINGRHLIANEPNNSE